MENLIHRLGPLLSPSGPTGPCPSMRPLSSFPLAHYSLAWPNRPGRPSKATPLLCFSRWTRRWPAGGYLAGGEAPVRRRHTIMTTTIPWMQLQFHLNKNGPERSLPPPWRPSGGLTGGVTAATPPQRDRDESGVSIMLKSSLRTPWCAWWRQRQTRGTEPRWGNGGSALLGHEEDSGTREG
jgi:hypothetical protein